MLVSLGGYKLAWIGPASLDDALHQDVTYVAGATDFLQDQMTAWWESSEGADDGSPPWHNTLQTVDDLSKHPWSDEQRAHCSAFDMRSSIVLPLDLNGRDGIIVVFDEVTFGFDETTVAGFQQIVEEIEFGLAHIQSIHQTEVALHELTVANHALQVAEGTLAESEQWFRELLANSSDLIVVLDERARVIYANPANAGSSG
jgi:PAS domain-containing protein